MQLDQPPRSRPSTQPAHSQPAPSDEGPADDESIPRKLEGWYRVEQYERDRLCEVGEDLAPGELCFLEKLWSDRVRVHRVDRGAGAGRPLGIAPLQRVRVGCASGGVHTGSPADHTL